MIQIIVHGCMGRMGQVLSSTAAAAADIEVVAGVDVLQEKENGDFPVFASLDECAIPADVELIFPRRKPCRLCWKGLIRKKFP